MSTYKVKVSYDGTNYFGWAKQTNGLKTIQNEIELTLSNIFNEKINIFASGRTDKYVHALDQCFHFKSSSNLPVNAIKRMCESKLPKDIRINTIKIVDDKFHARFSIKSKIYLYKINISKFNIFEQNYVYQYNKKINLSLIKKAMKLFIGEKDFLSFSTSEVSNTIRKIESFTVTKKQNYVYFKIRGNGFLRNMVRMIIATLINLNENKITNEDIINLINNPKKGSSIDKVPGCGLYLYKTIYN